MDGSNNTTISLDDFPANVRETITRYVRKNYDLKSLRLSSRSGLALVDGGLTEVNFVLKVDDLALRSDTPAPLFRWPHCSKVTLFLSDAEDSAVAGQLLALPGLNQPLEVRERIKSLILAGCEQTAPGLSLAAVLLSYPSLRTVQLGSIVPSDSLQQRFLYSALATLRHLEELHVHCSALQHICQLRSSNLRRLEVNLTPDGGLSDLMVTAIAELHQLQSLELFGLTTSPDRRCAFLGGLPPSVRNIRIYWGLDVDATLQLREGVLASCSLKPRFPGMASIELQTIARFVHEVLQPSGVMPQPSPPQQQGQQQRQGLDHVSISMVRLTAGMQLQGPGFGALRELLLSSRQVHVGMLVVDQGVTADGILDAVALLRVMADELLLWHNRGNGRSLGVAKIVFQTRIQQAAAVRGAAARQQQEQLAGAESPSLMHLGLESVRAAAAEAAANANAAETQEAVSSRPVVVVLRGPLLSNLAWAPGALDAWMRQLVEKAAQPGAITAYVPLPRAATVLVPCSSEAAAGALRAAAEGLAEELAAAAEGAPEFAGAPPQLHTVPVPVVGAARDPSETVVERLAPHALTPVLSKAAQSVWDGEGAAATWTVKQRLAWLLEQWKALKELNSEPVRLHRGRA